MKLDILVLAAHPDDAELSCSGTLLAEKSRGKKIGIIDYTRGELGSRGTAEIRQKEAETSAQILGIDIRENLGFRDGFFVNDEAHQLDVVRAIRQYRPEVVLANAVADRHPDHARAAELSATACFLSGLTKVATERNGQAQEAWRPKHLFHFLQTTYISPDFVVDISPYWEKKLAAIRAFATQFHTGEPSAEQQQTFISTPDFMHFIEGRAREFGQQTGATYAEGFTRTKLLLVNSFDAFC